MTRRTALITALVVSLLSAAPARALVVSATPAWNGWMRADMPSEITVRAISERGGSLEFLLTDRSSSYTHTAQVEPGAEFVWRLPLSPPAGESLRLHARLDGEEAIEQEIALRRHLAPSPLVAVLSERPIPLEAARVTTIHIAADALPFERSSYAAVDVVVVQRDSLKSMARQQLIALRQHAAECGRIVIAGFSPSAPARFAEFAGCGGRYLVAAQTPSELESGVSRLVEAPAPQLPSAGSLRTLFENRGWSRQIKSLAVFLAVYLSVLLIALRGQRAPAYFIGASVAGTAIALLAWSLSPQSIERVVWAETETGFGAARFTTMMRVFGRGDRVTLDIPPGAGPLRPLQSSGLTAASGADGGLANVSFEARLLSRHDFITTGIAAVQVPFLVELSGDRPRITNGGSGPSTPAVLAWDDGKYPVPALAPGEVWGPPAEPEPWGTSAIEQLFRQRAMREVTALLVENSPDASTAGSSASYLMVRP